MQIASTSFVGLATTGGFLNLKLAPSPVPVTQGGREEDTKFIEQDCCVEMLKFILGEALQFLFVISTNLLIQLPRLCRRKLYRSHE